MAITKKTLVTEQYLKTQKKLWLGIVQTARLCCGIPDYDNYLKHMRDKHPEQTPMDYQTFFRNRLDARYGGRDGAFRCC